MTRLKAGALNQGSRCKCGEAGGSRCWGAGGGELVWEQVWEADVGLKGREVMINQEDTVCVLT